MSATVVSARRSGHGSGRRTGWTSVRRATALLLWQAAPWVLVVLVVLSLIGGGLAAWSYRAAGRGGGPLVLQGDSGVAVGVSFFVGVASLFSWATAIRTAVPVLVAGGITRRAVTGGVLLAGTALAVTTTALLTLVALAGAALQRAVATRAAAVVEPSSGSDAYTSSLTIRYDAPANLFDPVETLPWFVIAALGGAMIGAVWYRWRARGVLGVLVVVGVAWSVYAAVVTGAVVDDATARAVETATRPPLVDVVPCLALAVGVWLVLRRVSLRPPAR